jgi:hypothetical protein
MEHLVDAHAGADTLISNKASTRGQNITYNQFTNLVFKNTGNVILISNAINTPAAGVQNSSYNSIAGTLTRVATTGSGTTVGLVCNSTATTATAADATISWTYNNFSNVTTAVGGFTGFINLDGPSAAGVNKNISYNTVSNISAPAGVTGISINNRGSNGTNGHVMRRNTFTNFTASTTGNVTGITTGTGNATLVATIDSNVIDNLRGQTIIGINSSANKTVVSNNTITRLSGTGTAASFGIQLSNSNAGEVANVFNNKVGDIENMGAVATAVAVHGIYKFSNTNTSTFNAYNNRIGDLRAPNSANLNVVSGISIGLNGTSTGAVAANLFYNTIFLNATTNVATSGSSCVMFTGASSTVSMNLRNNILVNLSTPGTDASNNDANGVSACLRRITGTGAAPANYASTSNNNLFWANPTAGTNNHLTYAEGYTAATMTAKKNTLADWTSFLAAASKTMDNLSVTESPSFLSLYATDADFLKINPGYIQKVSNAGAAISTPFSVAADFEGDARNATTPDIGADEYTQSPDAILPVGYALLNGRKMGTDNILTWSTYTEVNNKGFDVQRSLNGVNFETIGTVATKATNGNSRLTIHYSFTDRKLPAGTLYYRLKQKDIDDKITLSNIITIQEKQGQAGIAALYPNPARNQVVLSVNASVVGNIQLIVSDMNGKQMKTMAAKVMPGANSIGIDVSKLPAGIYNITLQMNEPGKLVTQKFIKQ